MKAVCKSCVGGRDDPQEIIGKLKDNYYVVFCPNCESLFISKKTFFSSTLKNQYSMRLLELIEFINAILDNSITSIKDVLDRKVMLPESASVYLIEEGYLVVNDEIGVKNKDGEFIHDVFLTNIYDDDERREVFREMRIEQIIKHRDSPKDISTMQVPWKECTYC